MNPRVAFALFALLLSACQTAPPVHPRDIEYGVDICGTCDEVIKDRRFAAEYVIAGNIVKKFDDPGCLFRALRNESAPPNAAFFQHVEDERWISDKDVWLVTTPNVTSPHGHNWAAYGSFSEAQNAVAEAGGGQILPFGPAKDRIARVMPTPMPTPEPTAEPTASDS